MSGHECELGGVCAGDPGRGGTELQCVRARGGGCGASWVSLSHRLSTRHQHLLAAEPRHLARWSQPPHKLPGSPRLCSACRRVPGLEIPRGLTLPLSHVRASLFPGREGHDPKVGIRPPVLPRVPSTQVRESGLGRMNSQPESARSSVPPQSPRSPTARCPGPGWGAGGRHVPPGPGGWSPEEPRASPESGIGPRLPRSRPRRAERTVPADRADRRLQLSPCLRPRCPESLGPPLEKPGGCVPQRDQNTGLERSQF